MIDTDKTAPRESPAHGGKPEASGRLRKHSVMIAGHRTSISLEDAFWLALERAARRRGESVASLVTAIDANRAGNLSSAIRLYVLSDLEDRLRGMQDPAANTRPRK